MHDNVERAGIATKVGKISLREDDIVSVKESIAWFEVDAGYLTLATLLMAWCSRTDDEGDWLQPGERGSRN